MLDEIPCKVVRTGIVVVPTVAYEVEYSGEAGATVRVVAGSHVLWSASVTTAYRSFAAFRCDEPGARHAVLEIELRGRVTLELRGWTLQPNCPFGSDSRTYVCAAAASTV